MASCLLPRKAWTREATSFASFLCSLRKRGVLPSCPVGGSLLDALVSLQGLCLLSGHPGHSESRLGGEGCLGFLSAPEASPETRGLVGSEGPTGCQRLGRDVLAPPVSPPLPPLSCCPGCLCCLSRDQKKGQSRDQALGCRDWVRWAVCGAQDESEGSWTVRRGGSGLWPHR